MKERVQAVNLLMTRSEINASDGFICVTGELRAAVKNGLAPTMPTLVLRIFLSFKDRGNQLDRKHRTPKVVVERADVGIRQPCFVKPRQESKPPDTALAVNSNRRRLRGRRNIRSLQKRCEALQHCCCAILADNRTQTVMRR